MVQHLLFDTRRLTPDFWPLSAGDARSVGGDARATSAERGHAHRHQGDQEHAARGDNPRAVKSHLQHGGAETVSASAQQRHAPRHPWQEETARMTLEPVLQDGYVSSFAGSCILVMRFKWQDLLKFGLTRGVRALSILDHAPEVFVNFPPNISRWFAELQKYVLNSSKMIALGAR